MRVHDSVFAGGRWVPSTSPERVEVVDSTTEEVMGSAPAGTAADVDVAVRAAREAFDGWADVPVEDRARLLLELADALERRSDELVDIITRETGMVVSACRPVQIGIPLVLLRTAARVATAFAYEEPFGTSIVQREPVGVAACIGPWNFPLNQIAKKAAHALAAGCTVVVKPSEVAPLDAFVLARATEEVGIPPGVFNLVPGRGSTVGEALVAHPDVDAVSFTGSTGAGRRVAELAAGTIKRVTLELGGKSAGILLDDLDEVAFARAVEAVVDNCYLNGGQTCTALTRLLVPAHRLAEAEEIAAAAAGAYLVGDPFDESSRLGPLASAQQRDRVQGYIRKGIADRAVLVSGGPDAPKGLDRGFYVEPTVFSRVDNATAIAREEIFGPVLCILAYDGDDDAVRLANDSPYGLSGGVWAADPDRAAGIARCLRTGGVSINGAPPNFDAPFGGYKQSGLGRENGVYGLSEFLEVKSIHR